MKKINLIFYNLKNYGDALNPQLFNELSGMVVQNKDYLPTLHKTMKRGIDYITTFDKSLIQSTIMPWQKTIVGIGSIIRMSNKRASIWGSGFMNQSERCKGGKLYAVRGKLTAQKLVAEGFPMCSVYGDPALLLPLWLPAQAKKIRLALIPHYKEVDHFIKKYGDQYHIIDLRTKDVQSVTLEISSCEYVLSTSLHGLIVAHAYAVPALWIKNGYIDTDGFKFFDYFSSVDIPLYQGFDQIDQILKSNESWLSLFNRHRDKMGINNSLQAIQIGLLKAAPFPLRSKYNDFIKLHKE